MPTLAKGYYLGQLVVFAKELVRVETGGSVRWVEQDVPMKRGTVVGIRSLQNGYTEWGDYGSYFNQTSRVSALLVATDIYKLPRLVPVGAAVSVDLIDYGDDASNDNSSGVVTEGSSI